MRKLLFLLVGLLIWGPGSYAQVATKVRYGVTRTTDSLNETRAGYALIPAAGKALKALIDANTSALTGKQATITSASSLTTGSVTSTSATSAMIYLTGASPAETATNTIRPLSGGGLELAGNTRLTSGGIGAGGNFDIKPDGNLYMQSNTNGNRSIFLHNEGISINRGTNTARAGVDIGSNTYVDGTLRVVGATTIFSSATVTGTLAVTGLTVNGAAITNTNSGDQTLSISGQQLTISGANGNTVTLPTSGTAVSQVTSVSTLAGLAAATTPQAIFDGSVWTRVSGNVNTDPGTNNLYTATQYNAGSDRYERQFLGRAKFEWWRFSSGNTWEQMKYAAGARIPVQFANGDYYTNERSYITPNTQFYGNSNTPDSVRIHITGPNPFWLMSWFWFDGTPGKRAEGIIIDGFSIYNESTFVANKDQNDFYGPISIDGGGARNIVIRNMNYKQVSSTAIVNAILVKMGTNKDGDGVLIDNVRSLSSTVAGRMLVEILNQGDGYSSSNPERTQIPARNVVIRNCIADNFRFGLSVAGNFVGAYIHNNIVRNCTDYGIEVAGPQPGVRVERNGFGGSHNVLIAGNAEGSVTADYMAAGQGQYYRDNYTEGTLTGTGGIIEIRGGGDMVFSGNKLRIGGGIFLRRTSAGGVLSADFSDNVIVSSATATNMTNKALLYIAGATNVRGFGNTFIRTSTDTQPYVQAATSTATSGYTATGVNSTGGLFFNNMFLGTTVPTAYFSATSPNTITSINNINQSGVITN